MTQLRKRSLSVRYRAKSGEPLARLLPEKLRPGARGRPAQARHAALRRAACSAASPVHHNSIVEMQTGEGKTLTATLPLYLAALEGKGCPPRHGERLPRPPRRRVDAAALRSAGHEGRRASKRRCRSANGARHTPATSPTARPTRWASISSAIGCSCGGSAKGKAICSARCWANRPAAATKNRCRASCISCSSTKPTAFSSTRPARR